MHFVCISCVERAIMRLDHIRYLRDIAQTSSISKTASHFFISPQALSKSIQQMESEVGARMLTRSPFGVRLTPEGERFLEKLGPFADEYDALHEEFLHSKETDGTPKVIRIGVSSVLAAVLLPKALSYYCAKYPDVILAIEEVRHDAIFPGLQNNKFDIAFLSVNDEYFFKELKAFTAQPIHYNLLFSDKLVACVSTSSPLANRETITHKDLKAHRWTSLNIVYREKGYEAIERYAKRHGANAYNMLYSGSNIDFHRTAMQELNAIALMPCYVFQSAFNSRHFVAKYVQFAPGDILHTALYPVEDPKPQLIELATAVQTVI